MMYFKTFKLHLTIFIFVYFGFVSSLERKDANKTEPVSTIIKATQCSSTWRHFRGKCYKIFSNNIESIENKDFDDAREFCEGLQGTLAKITNELEQDFLTTYLGEPAVRNRAWIGLEKRKPPGSSNYDFQWVDELTIANYTNFAIGEPNGDAFERCVHMDGSEAIAGQWNDCKCSEEMGFICQIELADNHTEIDKLSESNQCPEGFENYLGICYKIESDASDWFNAEEKCRAKHKGHLLSILDLYEESFVNLLTVDVKNELWIGLSDTNKISKGLFRWSDGRPIYHTHWSRTEPSGKKGSPRCVVRKPEDKKWAVRDCNTKLGYICTIHKEPHSHANTPPILGKCPKNWIDVGHRHCYLLVTTDKESFTYAQELCQDNEGFNGTLAKFRSEHELYQLRPFLTKYTDHRFMVGIHEEQYGKYQFIDEDEIASYLPWEKGEPNRKENEKCVELVTHHMQYNNFPCNRPREYICQVDKVIMPRVTEHPGTQGLSGGSVAGIVIFMMLLTAALSGIAFYIYRKKMLDDKMKAGIFRFQNENNGTTNINNDHNSSHI